jgi:hypothetical protein
MSASRSPPMRMPRNSGSIMMSTQVSRFPALPRQVPPAVSASKLLPS